MNKVKKRIRLLLVSNVIALFFIGTIVQYSCAGGNFYPFAIHQSVIFSFFFLLAIVMSSIELDFYFNHAYLFYIGTVVLLLVGNFSSNVAGSTRWIRVGSISFQPSEFAKVGLILALASYFKKQSIYKMMKLHQSLFKPFIIIMLPIFLVLKQPNLGTAVIMFFIGASIIFTVAIQRSHLIIFGIINIFLILTVYPFLRSYHKQRILSFLDLSLDPLGIGYNAQQSQIAIGSGGLFGKGFTNGSQTQLGFLPERHTDFAFTVLSEEWGFLGSMTLILLYTTFLAIIFFIAHRSRKYFSKLISVGIFTFFSAHFFINVGMTIGLLPIIGDPLPFLSYGGSTIAASLVCIGLLFSCISSTNDLKLSSRSSYKNRAK